MKFIVVTGADACGKDTQIDLLLSHYADKGVKAQALKVWDSLQDFSKALDQKTILSVLGGFLMKFEPQARSLFLQSCLKNSLDKIKSDAEVVIFNGYYYKYWASEMSYGVDADFWRTITSDFFPKPHQIFYLKLPVEEALKRRTDWSHYERGEARYAGKAPESFVDFQKSIHQNLELLLQNEKHQVIDAAQSADGVFNEILKRL